MWPADHRGQMCASKKEEGLDDTHTHHRYYLSTEGDEDFTADVLKIRFPFDRSCQDSNQTRSNYSNTREVHHFPSSSPQMKPDDRRRGIYFRSHRGIFFWSNNSINTVLICFALLFLSGFVTASKDFNFPDIKQEKFAQGLSHFHISWPIRVNELGQFVSQDVHIHRETVRSKRSVDNAEHDSSNDVPSQTTVNTSEKDSVHHFRIPIHQDKDVIVQVSRTPLLLSPSAVVERKVSKFRNISDSVFSKLGHHHGCHFVGKVQGDDNSKVALSACAGIRGFLQFGNEEYIIEPVKGFNKLKDGGHPHLVYKRSALPGHLDFLSRKQPKEPACGVKEQYEKALSHRERWERHMRSVTKKNTASTETSSSFSSSSSHSRKKRSISIEKHVETLVVVDTDMVNYYENEDIETYVLTVMNMVASLFHDASIGNAVNIVIVRIVLMQDPDEELQITHHADKTLKSFCKWQKGINFRDDDHPNHHDVAVLMTRRNICSRNNEPCSTLGLAQVAGLCQPHRTCSINEDTGLSLAWTVAHELGHNFGMKHDNQHSDCMADPEIQYVMAPHLTWDKTPSSWSNCSRAAITKFLDRNWGYCLDDPPGQHDFKYPELPAGTMYDADHQCRLLYGEGAERCNGIEVLENICTTLWCRVDNKCSTKLQAAAVGTICGVDKWCFAGQCVDIGERPQAIDGQWGEWAEWTDCTRTCGAGVSLSQRHCSNPPPSNGGKYCTGERKRYRICNTDNCPEDAPSFRTKQCAEFNEIPYKGTQYQWEPVATPETPCQLHCKPKDFFFSVMLKDIVTDGTPCVMGSRHMCISGRCRHVGCDWIIDSSATEDRCGVCYGDGSTCETIKEQFNETKIQGYVEAAVIPAGARNIRVEEVAEASNFLALKNDAGEYYLNGHWFIQWSGDYEVAGTVIHYNRVGNKEKFLAPGPLKESLHIMLLMQTHNPGVEFEYTVPKENATNTKKLEFSWDYMTWSHCTVSCGGGTQRSAVVCKEQEAGLVDERHCDQSTRPDDQMRACNVHLCPARWWTGPWQHCSVTCDEGTHQRTVICVRSMGPDEQIALEDQACEGLPKPVEIEGCHHKDPCPRPGVWKVEEWSNCTKQCDGGSQVRNITCVGETSCNDEKPEVLRTCNEHKCADDLSMEILNIKEGGEQENNDILLSESSSSLSLLNVTSTSNNSMLPLGDDGNNFLITNSSSDLNEEITINNNVNIENSHSHKHRHHHHHSKSKDGNVTSSVHEGGSWISPDSEKMNKVDIVPLQVGDNTQSVLPNQFNTGNTTFTWQTLQWSKCSSQCGQGVRTRQVFCIQKKTNEKVGNDLCNIGNKPSAIEECFESICLEWQTGDWEQCSATCGYARQFRQVICANPGQCDILQKPESTRVCKDLSSCISWVYGDWSKCTKSCGLGSQERLVQCVNLTSQQLSQGCIEDLKPPERQDCNEHECPADDNAALTISCESNEMSFNVCQMLKKVGLCHKQYVQSKCCRTCHHDDRPKPDVSNLS